MWFVPHSILVSSKRVEFASVGLNFDPIWKFIFVKRSKEAVTQVITVVEMADSHTGVPYSYTFKRDWDDLYHDW